MSSKILTIFSIKQGSMVYGAIPFQIWYLLAFIVDISKHICINFDMNFFSEMSQGHQVYINKRSKQKISFRFNDCYSRQILVKIEWSNE